MPDPFQYPYVANLRPRPEPSTCGTRPRPEVCDVDPDEFEFVDTDEEVNADGEVSSFLFHR